MGWTVLLLLFCVNRCSWYRGHLFCCANQNVLYTGLQTLLFLYIIACSPHSFVVHFVCRWDFSCFPNTLGSVALVHVWYLIIQPHNKCLQCIDKKQWNKKWIKSEWYSITNSTASKCVLQWWRNTSLISEYLIWILLLCYARWGCKKLADFAENICINVKYTF